MKLRIEFQMFMLPFILLSLLVGGCVTQGRFQKQMDENQSLSDQLQEAKERRTQLEKESDVLKQRIAGLNSKLQSEARAASENLRKRNNEIDDLHKQVTLAETLQRRTESDLKNQLREIEQNYKPSLAKTRGKISELESLRSKQRGQIADLKNTLSDRNQDITLLKERLELSRKDLARLQGALKGSEEESKSLIADLQRRLSDRDRDTIALKGKLLSSERSTARFKKASEDSNKRNKNLLSDHQRRLSERQERIAQLETLLRRSEKNAARISQELADSEKAHKGLVVSLQKEINDGSIKITRLKGRLTVEIVDKILFSSGSDQITSGGHEVLKKVGNVLKDVAENDIRVEGHTDNVGIGPKLRERFASNWELSTARATRVVRFLLSQGVQPEKLLAAGYSKFRPVVSNETPEGRQRNRRIEIVLFPRDVSKIIEGD